MLVLTLGDPLSVTIECLFRLKNLWSKADQGPMVLVGSHEQWLWQVKELRLEAPSFELISAWTEIRGHGLYFLNVTQAEFKKSPKDLTAKERGLIAKLALDALRSLPDLARLAVVTAPIDKFAASQAGYAFPGQTEFFCDLWQGQGIMILAGSKLRVGLATNHVKLSDVTALVSHERVLEKIMTLNQSLQDVLGIKKPRLAVAALNPHAGDKGLFGDEDIRILAPAIEVAKNMGIDVVGPKPADTLFFQAYSGHFDGVLAMYHDQGLGPLKTVHFYDAVNISGGLKHLRISPDHGPAGELYGKNEAKEDSFALSLVHARNYLGW